MAVRGPYDSSSAHGSPRTLGERIKALRVLRQKTQAEVADALGSDQATVSLWERDRVRPAGASLAGIAAYFGTTVKALETGAGVPWSPAAPEPTDPAAPAPASSLQLQALPPGGVQAVDLGTGETHPLDAMGAMAQLMAALKAGRRVWIVTK